ncbi:phage integrase family protein [Paraburkholderia sp. A1RI-2L]|uniref:phage integrase family protein n=1 Tax=Paraburkholderia sp. A1RI-2L TaxID=3028367 RepID=UPI003B803EAC
MLFFSSQLGDFSLHFIFPQRNQSLAEQMTRKSSERRKVGADHFAFYRAYLEGVEIDKAAERYLHFSPRDVRSIRSEFKWIRQTLTLAATRSGDRRSALLLGLGPIPVPAASGASAEASNEQTLETFAAEFDPEGVLSESDLIAYFEEAQRDRPVAADRRASGAKERLRVRQLAALRSLEVSLVDTPKLHHMIVGWLEPALAARLNAAQIYTLDDLVNRCNRDGHRWWTKIAGLGEKRATRVTSWLTGHSDSIGHVLSQRALVPRRQLQATTPEAFTRAPTASIAPLEALTVPASLDGSTGRNRAPIERKQIDANNDYAAIYSWLRDFEHKPHTWRAYRTQAERLLLWSIFARGKALSSLNTDDARAFRDFLLNPEPADVWVGPHGAERWSPAWRPFTGPLSASSCKMAIAAASSLCGWLTSQLYLASNPFRGVKVSSGTCPEPGGDRDPSDRSLSIGQWHFLINGAYSEEAAALSPTAFRDRFLLLLGCFGGLRVSEIASAKVQDLKHFEAADPTDVSLRWYLRVIGKGKKSRKVPLPTPLVDALRAYLLSRGYTGSLIALAASKDPIPLVGRLDGNDRAGLLSASTVGETYKRIFTQAARLLGDSEAAEDLRRASGHWLRHTHATHSIRLGTSPAHAKDNLGHASIATTSQYTHIEINERWEPMEKFARGMLPST